MVGNQTQEQERKWQELQKWEQELLSLRAMVGEYWGRVNLYQEMLRPVQDSLDALRQRLQGIAGILSQSQETGNHQRQAIDQIRQKIVKF
jgi:chromosome segregation ATPase